MIIIIIIISSSSSRPSSLAVTSINRGSSGENWSSFYCFAKQPRKVAEGLRRDVHAAPFAASAIASP
jgi:hypothetical protein